MTDAPQESFLQIGDAAERAGVTQRTLRYYEEKGLMRPPTRMDGGFRLYTEEDLARLERIKELKDLLGFSLAEIKEMLEADDIKLQIRTEWRNDLNTAEKIEKLRTGREMTLRQLALLDQKMGQMSSLRNELAERAQRYDQWLQHWSSDGEHEPSYEHDHTNAHEHAGAQAASN